MTAASQPEASRHDASRHDAWQAAESYDLYMGRWSRRIAPRFLEWLDPAAGLDWLDVGCGTGALAGAVVAGWNPRRLIGLDASGSFVEKARSAVSDPRAQFHVGDAGALPVPTGTLDLVVSGLMLNFVPDREAVLGEMRRATRPGGMVAFYVWDYPGGGLEFLRAFWAAAAALDPAAADLGEDRRFPFCTRGALAGLALRAGLAGVEAEAIEVPTRFETFDDFWRPFTLGAGPAPGYCAKLGNAELHQLKDRLQGSLPYADDGSIPFAARAWAVRGINAEPWQA